MSQATSARNKEIRVAVVGATGLAGQQFLTALDGHPFLRVVKLAGSSRSAGKSYLEAIRSESGQIGWYADGPLNPKFRDLVVEPADQLDLSGIDLVFTAIDSGPARELEPVYAAECPVISTASAFRYEDDVPLLLPGVNGEQVKLLDHQRQKRGWKGFVAPNPNCTTVGLAMTLAPLHRAFGIRRVHMVSLQAVSGAGRSPGVIALDAIDNVVPYIPKEEGKVEAETRKILGTLEGDHIVPADFGISATCTRIGVIEGHTEVVHVELDKDADEAQIAAAWTEHGSEVRAAGYPSCPESLIHVHTDPFRPQVRLDRDFGNGMTTVVGRLRRDDNATNGWKYVLVSHNTKMGAATGCVLVAEQLIDIGYIAPR